MFEKITRFFQSIRQLSPEYGKAFSIRLIFAKYFNEKKYKKMVRRRLDCEFAKFISNYKINDNSDLPLSEKIIWVPWWQGEENMPEIVKEAYNSILENRGQFTVIQLNENNISSYYEIPPTYLDKYRQNKISIIHLCDIIRVNLLRKYGGIWLDGTCFLNKQMPMTCIENVFYSRHVNIKENTVSEGRWSGYFLATGRKEMPLFVFLSDFYELYWKEHDVILTYLLLDYLIDLAYRHFDYIKEMIDNIPVNNADVRFLQENMNRMFDAQKWQIVSENTFVHKLAWRFEINNNTTSYFNVVVRNKK